MASSEYHATSAPSTSANGIVRPMTFPSGCGLWVIVYKSGDYMVNSSLTSCTSRVTAIEMYGGIAREHWYGWQELNNGDAYDEGQSSLSLYVDAYCRGSGSYVYAGTTNGQLIRGGTTYNAAAYDSVSSTRC